METFLEKLSKERKEMQASGDLPEWFITLGLQMLKEKYAYKDNYSYKDIAKRIASHAAKFIPHKPDWWGEDKNWEDEFYRIIFSGNFSCSTPVLSNMGTDRGSPVSCSGNYVGDSIREFYGAQQEVAILTQEGFGTASYLGDIRPRGSKIKRGGTASGVMPVIQDFVQLSNDVSQGSQRRGAWAGYLPINHGDFFEVARAIEKNPDDINVGWNVYDSDLAKFDKDPVRFKQAMYTKSVTGKGYFFFPDKVNRHRPQAYVNNNLYVNTSQLCTEIALFCDEMHTFTCVLGSINLVNWDNIKDSEDIFIATVFLECVALAFIERAKNIPGLEKAVRFTEKGGALGLGVMGFHTYLQQNMIPFESFEAHMTNNQIFDKLKDESERASKWMATVLGEREWTKGTGMRNTHLRAIAPTMSTALIMGGASQGIEPVVANVFMQPSAAGEVERINPVLLKIMKERGKNTKKVINELNEKKGSVQHVDWLSDHEKAVFKTAFEIDQRAILRLASQRQRRLDQTQSLNLFFSSEEKESVIAQIHKEAFLDEWIWSLYYMRTESGVLVSNGECSACQ